MGPTSSAGACGQRAARNERVCQVGRGCSAGDHRWVPPANLYFVYTQLLGVIIEVCAGHFLPAFCSSSAVDG